MLHKNVKLTHKITIKVTVATSLILFIITLLRLNVNQAFFQKEIAIIAIILVCFMWMLGLVLMKLEGPYL